MSCQGQAPIAARHRPRRAHVPRASGLLRRSPGGSSGPGVQSRPGAFSTRDQDTVGCSLVSVPSRPCRNRPFPRSPPAGRQRGPRHQGSAGSAGVGPQPIWPQRAYRQGSVLQVQLRIQSEIGGGPCHILRLVGWDCVRCSASPYANKGGFHPILAEKDPWPVRSRLMAE